MGVLLSEVIVVLKHGTIGTNSLQTKVDIHFINKQKGGHRSDTKGVPIRKSI